MGGFSIWHWIIVGAIVLLLFGGGGKISSILGDLGKGVKSFKKGLAEEDTPPKALHSERVAEAQTSAKADEAAKN